MKKPALIVGVVGIVGGTKYVLREPVQLHAANDAHQKSLGLRAL
jgi:hypothetical protein